MKLPNVERARIDAAKLRDYLLAPDHPVGRFKAVFFAALGFRQSEWKALEEALRRHVESADVVLGRPSRYGVKYLVRGILEGPDRSAGLESVWIVRTGEDEPRFVTAYPGD